MAFEPNEKFKELLALLKAGGAAIPLEAKHLSTSHLQFFPSACIGNPDA